MMLNILKQIKLHTIGPTRLAPGVWKVVEARWGAVHEYRLAKLCALGRFPEAEQRAVAALAAATRPNVSAAAMALALHDLACVFQAQGKFNDAVKVREQFRAVARTAIESRWPGTLSFCDEMRQKSQTLKFRWPQAERHSALQELASAEEALVDAYTEERRFEDALAACDFAIDVRYGIGDEKGAERVRKSRAVLGRISAELHPEPSTQPIVSLRELT
jgi:tetratricopeptide (TPR) repeat protein